jgi:hypothetical protein
VLRTYGRITNEDGSRTWVEVTTDAAGNDDMVWVVTLAQTLQMNLGESPFFGNYGIPGQQSVIQQIFPDFYVSQTQSQFSQYFASLQIAKLNSPSPNYRINVTTHQGTTPIGPIPS